MIIQIGIEDKKLNIYQLIIQKKEDLFKDSEWLKKLHPINNQLCSVQVDDEDAVSLCKILSEIIIENLEIRYLVSILKEEYKFLTEKEQCEILVFTLKSVWEKEACFTDIIKAKEDVASRLNDIINSNSELMLEGFMRFRMKDYLKHWRNVLKKSINSYLANQEYDEFISIVKYFVRTRSPKHKTINVFIKKENEFAIFDESMCFIDDSKIIKREKLNTYNLEKFDVLLSILISIAPRKILVHNKNGITDDLFVTTLNKIFGDQVFYMD